MGNFSCDAVMLETHARLVEDLGGYIGLNASKYRCRNAAEMRNMVYPHYLSSDIKPYMVKCLRQLEQFCNRYRFADDVLGDADLAKVAYDKFMHTQLRICKPMRLNASTYLVVQRARKICKDILGEVPSDDEIYRNGSFSKRATTFSTLAESYFHSKLRCITGSRNHISWFYDQLACDPLLAKAIHSVNGRPREVEKLNVSFVPKSWKTFRTVTPNSLIGSFWSIGVGRIVAEKLACVGLNIHTLQVRQREFAKSASCDGSLATADLSAASDSFVAALLNRLLPRGWYRLLKLGRVDHVRIKNPYDGTYETNYLQSFMAMGIGYTFPIQTLLFYALLRAIQQLTRKKGKITVYGDDLIYPVEIHNQVVEVFGNLGFLLNRDKSFASGYFRESCGGDFYKGVDVRPAMVDFHHTSNTAEEWLTCIYRLYNSLRARWDECELPRTFTYLEDLVVKVFGRCHVVPSHFPDTAGFKFADIPERFLDKVKLVKKIYPATKNRPVSYTWHLAFTSLGTTVKGLRIKTEEQYPYLWLKLTVLEQPEKDLIWANKPEQLHIFRAFVPTSPEFGLVGQSSFKLTNVDVTELKKQGSSDILYWKRVKVKVRGRKIRRLRAYTSFKKQFWVKETDQSVTDWNLRPNAG